MTILIVDGMKVPFKKRACDNQFGEPAKRFVPFVSWILYTSYEEFFRSEEQEI